MHAVKVFFSFSACISENTRGVTRALFVSIVQSPSARKSFSLKSLAYHVGPLRIALTQCVGLFFG